MPDIIRQKYEGQSFASEFTEECFRTVENPYPDIDYTDTDTDKIALVTSIGRGVIAIVKPEKWREESACKGLDPNMFFPGPNDTEDQEEAHKVCSSCPVTEECMEYALANNIDHGIWGDMSERQRKKFRRNLKKQQKK